MSLYGRWVRWTLWTLVRKREAKDMQLADVHLVDTLSGDQRQGNTLGLRN